VKLLWKINETTMKISAFGREIVALKRVFGPAMSSASAPEADLHSPAASRPSNHPQ
jgi:hypothetical protein